MPHCQWAPARAAGVARHVLPVNLEADSDYELGRPLFGASTPEPARLETIEERASVGWHHACGLKPHVTASLARSLSK